MLTLRLLPNFVCRAGPSRCALGGAAVDFETRDA